MAAPSELVCVGWGLGAASHHWRVAVALPAAAAAHPDHGHSAQQGARHGAANADASSCARADAAGGAGAWCSVCSSRGRGGWWGRVLLLFLTQSQARP